MKYYIAVPTSVDVTNNHKNEKVKGAKIHERADMQVIETSRGVEEEEEGEQELKEECGKE